MEFVLKRLIWFFLRSMMLTYRFSYREVQYLQSAKEKSPNGTFVFAMWHELVWPTMAAHAWREPYLALASRSKDGNYAAFIAEKVGFTSVRGSSRKGNKDKGGKEAMMIYINGLKNKMSAGMTVDGPKGPRQVCKPGIAIIAKETGSPDLANES
jgi:lysophospholipid acyltransferase (LPLAT)-like uncharacterized protein